MEPVHISESLRALTDQEKKGLQKLEPKDSATGVEKQFVKALKTPQIIQRPPSDLIDVIKFVMMKVGIRNENLPSELETQVLLEHIVNYYGSHTHEEFKLAFELAITDRLVFPEKQDAHHYGDFSCAYVSKIMNAYRSWASKTYKTVVKEKTPELTGEKLSNTMYIDWWKSASKDVRTGKITYAHVAAQLYDWAISQNDTRLPADIEKSVYLSRYVKLHIQELVEDVKNKPELRGQLEDFTRMKNQKRVEALYADFVIRQSKRMAVYDVMKTEQDEVTSDLVGDKPAATV